MSTLSFSGRTLQALLLLLLVVQHVIERTVVSAGIRSALLRVLALGTRDSRSRSRCRSPHRAAHRRAHSRIVTATEHAVSGTHRLGA